MEDEDEDKSSTDLMFKSLDKLSPRVVGGQQPTSPYAGARKGDNFLSILLEEKEEDDMDDSLDRSKRENMRADSKVEIDIEEVKQELVRESELFNRDTTNLRPNQVQKVQKQARTVSQQTILTVADQTRDTLTKKAMHVASSREKEKSKAVRQSDLFRKSQANPILKERLIEEKEKLSLSLKEATEQLRGIWEQKEELLKQKSKSGKRIWLPKVFCIFSPYQFYDYYVDIIKELVEKIQNKGLDNLFEAFIYEIVCKIETPVTEPVIYRGVKIQRSSTRYSLPYIAESFFTLLFRKLDVNTIITIFTHLLCEEKCILVAENQETLIPIWQALHSTIYPFRYAHGTPYRRDDGGDDDDNEMAGVCPPMPFFNGIVRKDKDLAIRIIEFEDYPSPLFIDLTAEEPSKMFHFINRNQKNQNIINSQGLICNKNNQNDLEMRRLSKHLPCSVKDKLKSKIEKRL